MASKAKIIVICAILGGGVLGILYWKKGISVSPLPPIDRASISNSPAASAPAGVAQGTSLPLPPTSGNPDDAANAFIQLSSEEQTALRSEENDSAALMNHDAQAMGEFDQIANEKEF